MKGTLANRAKSNHNNFTFRKKKATWKTKDTSTNQINSRRQLVHTAMLHFTTLLAITLTTLNACSFNLPGTSIKNWPSSNDIRTDATPLPFYKRALTCTSQKWSLQKLMRLNKISIPTCLSTIKRKCRSTSASSYSVCLSDFCGNMGSDARNTNPVKPLSSMTTMVETTVNQSQSVVDNLKDENWLTLILFISSIISTATIMALIFKKKSQKTKKSDKKTDEKFQSFGLYPKIPKILTKTVPDHA